MRTNLDGLSLMQANRRRRRHTQRYGGRHRLVRRSFAASVRAGLAVCARCQLPIDPSEPWDLGHDDATGGYSGPEHAVCNRGAPMRNVTSRVW